MTAFNTKTNYEPDKQNAEWRVEAVTDEKGVFHILHLGEGTYTVAVSGVKQDKVAIAATGIMVKSGIQTAVPTPFVLQSGAILEGKVVSKSTGKPLKGVQVVASGPQAPEGVYGSVTPTDTTKDDGTYHLRVAPGEGKVRISTPPIGFAYSSSTIPVTVHAGETKTLAPIELAENLTVILHVTDESGKAVPDLPLRVWHPGWSDGRSWDEMQKTDASGNWDSAKNPYEQISEEEKAPWEIRVPNGWDVVSPKELKLPTTGPVTVVVKTVDISKQASGRVLSSDGKPIANVIYFLFLAMSRIKTEIRADYKSDNILTDKEGQFALPLLRPNSFLTIDVSQWEYRLTKRGISEPVLKIPADGTQPKLGDWVLTPLTGSVSGIVTNTTGKPLPGVWLWSYDGDMRSVARTDAKGAFTVNHLLPTGRDDCAGCMEKRFWLILDRESNEKYVSFVCSCRKSCHPRSPQQTKPRSCPGTDSGDCRTSKSG